MKNRLLATLWATKAQTRNLKLIVFAGSLGRLGVLPKDLDEARKDNLLSDIGCVERILL